MATYLSRTPSTTGNRKTWTWSGWVKRNLNAAQQNLIAVSTTTTTFSFLYFNPSNQLVMYSADDGATGGYIQTTRQFNDVNGWYHIVCTIDTANSTANDRIKLYVNGQQETSFVSRVNPILNYDFYMNTSGNRMDIGSSGTGMSANSNVFYGLMSYISFIDGTAYDASYFGETDATTGEWKIKTSPSVTYGTNGFFILKDGNSVTDQSGNGNNYTVGNGTLTKTEDNPSNVFATFNPLNQTTVGTNVYSSGNTDLTSSPNVNEFHGASTLGMTSGKYYAEFKMKNGQFNTVGITSTPSNDARTNVAVRTSANSYGLYSYNGKLNTSTYGASYTAPNIIGVAVDLDNNKIYFSRNGNWATGSGAWGSTTWASGTGAFTITDPSLTVEGAYFFAIGEASAGSSGKFSANFGNGYQGTTAVSSAGTNASGIGIFEYDVPTGFTALSTKGLNL